MGRKVRIPGCVQSKLPAGLQRRITAVDTCYDPSQGVDGQDAEDRNKKTVLELVRPFLNKGIDQIKDAKE